MPLAFLKFACSFGLVDEAGNKASFRFEVEGADHAAAMVNGQLLATALAATTTALVQTFSVNEVWAEDTEEYGAADSEVENIASVSCRLEKPGVAYHTFKIPSPIIGLFTDTTGPGKNIVDNTALELVNFIELFTDKTGYTTPGAANIATVSEGDTVAPNNVVDRPQIYQGKRIHRASRRG